MAGLPKITVTEDTPTHRHERWDYDDGRVTLWCIAKAWERALIDNLMLAAGPSIFVEKPDGR